MQFITAAPVVGEAGLWELRGRLRGQAGTDAFMPAEWPSGSTVVLLNGAARQVSLPPSALGQMRHWRIGPALRGPDDASYRAISTPINGAGLRPLKPCHLRGQGRRLTWIRRTRIGGDGWEGPDVPLSESREAYLLRLIRDGAIIHEVSLGVPEYTVPQPIWDGGDFTAAVAQLSDQYGVGPFVRRDIHVWE